VGDVACVEDRTADPGARELCSKWKQAARHTWKAMAAMGVCVSDDREAKKEGARPTSAIPSSWNESSRSSDA